MELIAQVVGQMADEMQWAQYGLGGVVIWWLMHKHDTSISGLRQEVKDAATKGEQNAHEIKTAILEAGAKQEHKITGLSRTILIDLLSRKELSPEARLMAQVELEKANGK